MTRYLLSSFLIFMVFQANALTNNDVLSVQNGVYYLDGAPFAEIGWNKFDINWMFFDELYAGRTLDDNNAMVIKQRNSIRELAESGVKTIRFFGCVHSNNFNKKWLPAFNDSVKRLTMCDAAMDKAISICEEFNIRAIVSLMCDNFVNTTTTPAENIRELVADPNSKSRAFLYDYLNHVINRYKDRKGVLAWEVSNEMTLECDILPGTHINASGVRMPTHAQLSQFYKDVCAKIKTYDPLRMVTSGGSVLREMAYGLSKCTATQTSWPDRDTYSHHKSMYQLIYDNSGFQNVDIHFYLKKAPNYQIYSDNGSPLLMNEQLYNNLATTIAKPMMLGEYGALPKLKTDPDYWLTGNDWFETFDGEPADAQQYVQEAADRAVDSGCRLIYWWCYASQRPQDQNDPQRMDLDRTRTPVLFQKVVDASNRLKQKYNITSSSGNNLSENQNKIWYSSGDIYFSPDLYGKLCRIFNLQGTLIKEFVACDHMPLNITDKGIYLVRAEEKTLKISNLYN